MAAHELDWESGGVVPSGVLAAMAAWQAGPAPIDPMHVIDRSLGGCDAPECVVPARRWFHDRYDAGGLDILVYLTVGEQAHAAGHVGIVSALQRVTGSLWRPVREGGVAPEGDVLPVLGRAEQAGEVVRCGGLVAALELLTGEPWRREMTARSGA